MKLPKEYQKFIGNFDACSSSYGRKMLIKFGHGPETKAEPKKKSAGKKKKTTK